MRVSEEEAGAARSRRAWPGHLRGAGRLHSKVLLRVAVRDKLFGLRAVGAAKRVAERPAAWLVPGESELTRAGACRMERLPRYKNTFSIQTSLDPQVRDRDVRRRLLRRRILVEPRKQIHTREAAFHLAFEL